MAHCQCGLIKFTGRQCSVKHAPADLLRQCDCDPRISELFLISPKSIHVEHMCGVITKRHTANMCSVECKRCGNKLTLLEANTACFCLLVKKEKKIIRRASQPFTLSTETEKNNLMIQRYVVDDSIKTEKNDIPFLREDEERSESQEEESSLDLGLYDFMFSGTSSLVLGSYRDTIPDIMESSSA